MCHLDLLVHFCNLESEVFSDKFETFRLKEGLTWVTVIASPLALLATSTGLLIGCCSCGLKDISNDVTETTTGTGELGELES